MQQPQLTYNNRIYTMVGVTDEITQCGCCGKANLKKTIVLKEVDGGEFVFFGSTCGAKALRWTDKPEKKITAKALLDRAESEARMAALQARVDQLNAHPLYIQAQVIMAPFYYDGERRRDFREYRTLPGFREALDQQATLVAQARAELGMK